VFGQFHCGLCQEQIQLKYKNSILTVLQEEEFEFIGSICTLIAKLMSHFPPPTDVSSYTIVLVIVE